MRPSGPAQTGRWWHPGWDLTCGTPPNDAQRIVGLTVMDKALVSRVLAALQRRPLVTAAAPKTDPRRRTWRLTSSGQDLVEQLRPERRRREAILQSCLSQSERTLLLDFLQRLFVASESRSRVRRARQAEDCGDFAIHLSHAAVAPV